MADLNVLWQDLQSATASWSALWQPGEQHYRRHKSILGFEVDIEVAARLGEAMDAAEHAFNEALAAR